MVVEKDQGYTGGNYCFHLQADSVNTTKHTDSKKDKLFSSCKRQKMQYLGGTDSPKPMEESAPRIRKSKSKNPQILKFIELSCTLRMKQMFWQTGTSKHYLEEGVTSTFDRLTP